MAGSENVLFRDGSDAALKIKTIEQNSRSYVNQSGVISAGDVVYQVSGVDDEVSPADADDSGKVPPIGIVEEVVDATNCIVMQTGGVATSVTGLTRGVSYWLDTTAGALTATRPTQNVFFVGVATTSTSILVSCLPQNAEGRVTVTMTAGAGGIAAGDAVYISAANTVLKADGDAIGTGRFLGIAEAAITAAASGTIITQGLITNATIESAGDFTVGDPVFLSSTPGELTATAPNGVVSDLGIAISTSEFLLQPKIPIVLTGAGGTAAAELWQQGPFSVPVSGGNTVNHYGWVDRAAICTRGELLQVTVATVGAYTFALTKVSGSANMLSTATVDLTAMSDATIQSLTMTGTVSNRTLADKGQWKASFVSDNAGLDAEGVYFSLTFQVNS